MAVFVLDKRKRPLMPCSEKRARLLLERGRAVVHRMAPFTIRLKDRLREDCALQPVRLCLDPGSRTSGMALVREKDRVDPVTGGIRRERVVLHLFDLAHRGHLIHKRMLQRRALRRGRRGRKTRYRAPRFYNRRRPKRWLAPSLRHRVETVMSWVGRLRRWAPITGLSIELVRFDTRKLQNPEVSGVEYQRGELFGYEVREYLLEKWGRKCAYCGAENVPLEVEHIVPKSRGGTDRVSNLTLACRSCNKAKGSRDVRDFLENRPNVLKRALAQAKAPLKDAAAVNATRWRLFESLKATGLPLETGTGGRTKWNRTCLNIPKAHALDAACVGRVDAVRNWRVPTLEIRCAGRGGYQRTRLNRHGFPRGFLMRRKQVHGFQTGDMARAEVVSGKNAGVHVGRVAVRASGSFNLRTPAGIVQGIHARYCRLLQRADGYGYSFLPKPAASPSSGGLAFFQGMVGRKHDETRASQNRRWNRLGCGRSDRASVRLGTRGHRRGVRDAVFVPAGQHGNQVVDRRGEALGDTTPDADALDAHVARACRVDRMARSARAGAGATGSGRGAAGDLCRRARTRAHGLDDADGRARGVAALAQTFIAPVALRFRRGKHDGRHRVSGRSRPGLAVCLGLAAALATSSPGQSLAAAACPSYDIFKSIISDVCWDCMFPIIIAGVKMGGGSKPPGAAKNKVVCTCKKKIGFGFSMWEPARLVEVVRRPYCFPLFGGKIIDPGAGKIGVDGMFMGGRSSDSNDNDSSDKVFYNYHYFAFPLAIILDLFSGCNPDGFADFDLMYISELDPTWNDDELAFFTNPEVVLVANPVAQAACIADAVASTAGHPLQFMFWCAGSWGGLYPFTGNILTNGSPPRDSSLIVARALAALHRRALAWKTMGDAARCSGYIYPSLVKTQYKFEQMFPLAEAKSNHWIGQSSFKWGEWRNIPGAGEDFVHMVWRWIDCCVPLF